MSSWVRVTTWPHKKETGAGLTIHPGRDSAAPWHVIQTVKEAGGDLDRTIMCHIDRTLFNLEAMLELAEKGRYLVFLLMIARMVRY